MINRSDFKTSIFLGVLIFIVFFGTIASAAANCTGNNPPQAIMKGKSQGSTGEVISFDGSRSEDDGEIVSYAWDFGDGHQDEGPRVSHIFWKGGDYVITLTVTDQCGQKNRTTAIFK